jgi:hypothetical protein
LDHERQYKNITVLRLNQWKYYFMGLVWYKNIIINKGCDLSRIRMSVHLECGDEAMLKTIIGWLLAPEIVLSGLGGIRTLEKVRLKNDEMKEEDKKIESNRRNCLF